jgi:hypothetical protein
MLVVDSIAGCSPQIMEATVAPKPCLGTLHPSSSYPTQDPTFFVLTSFCLDFIVLITKIFNSNAQQWRLVLTCSPSAQMDMIFVSDAACRLQGHPQGMPMTPLARPDARSDFEAGITGAMRLSSRERRFVRWHATLSC